MRMHRFWEMLMVVFVFAFAGCNDEDETTISGPGTNPGEDELVCRLLNNRDVDRLGGDFYWAVEASEAWTLDSATYARWISVDPLRGEAGTTDVTIHIDTLFGTEARSAILPFQVGTQEVQITVRQTLEGDIAGAPVVRFADDKMLGVDGGELVRIIQASDDWTLETSSDWLEVSPLSGVAGETELTFTAQPSEGILRVAALKFTMRDTVVELPITQSLNQSRPLFTLPQEPVVLGAQVEMMAQCQFINDELALEEIGFAYKPKGEDTWEYAASELVATSGIFEYRDTLMLKWATEYVYRPYAKLGGETYLSDIEGTFATETRVVEGGVWYYENFDGMYDAESGTYAEAAIAKNYSFNNAEADFVANNGYLRQNQPSASYSWANFRVNITNGSNDGFISAYIQPEGNALGWQFPSWATPGTQFYEGASGNWKAVSYYRSDWTCTITGLDFSGASDLQLTFGCYYSGSGSTSSDGLPDAAAAKLTVEVSSNGTDWETMSFSYNTPLTQEKRWKHIVVDNFPNTAVAIRISINDSGYVWAVDDIKVTEK